MREERKSFARAPAFGRSGEDAYDVVTEELRGGGGIERSRVRRVTDHLADDGYPSWSPDGRWLAFDANRAGSFDLWIVDAVSGGDPTRVTDDPAYEQAPVWVSRPEGRPAKARIP